VGFLGLATSGRGEKKRLLTEAVAHLRRAGDFVDCCFFLIELAAFALADENSLAALGLLEENIAICEDLDLPMDLAAAFSVLVDATMCEGRFEEATVWLQKSLRINLRQYPQDSAAGEFPNVVCCVARLGDAADAARLTGAYNAMLSRHVPPQHLFTAE